MTEDHFMHQALLQAQQAYDEGEIPVGAVVVANDRVIARAYNQTERLSDPTAHAEMLALTAAFDHLGAKYLPDCTLYVTLEPCVMCAGAIHWAHLGQLVWATDDAERGFRRYNGQILHRKTTVRTGVMAAEARELLQRFFQKIRRRH
ncbi:MAG: nucleoside deaminase [Tunicatimonas sp.]